MKNTSDLSVPCPVVIAFPGKARRHISEKVQTAEQDSNPVTIIAYHSVLFVTNDNTKCPKPNFMAILKKRIGLLFRSMK